MKGAREKKGETEEIKDETCALVSSSDLCCEIERHRQRTRVRKRGRERGAERACVSEAH